MADFNTKSHGTQPPPQNLLGPHGHSLPRRTSPANSVTLRHHRLARDGSTRANSVTRQPDNTTSNSKSSSNRRNSSGDSHDTSQSDPRNWFDQSNENPTATFGIAMDVEPPFFQKESDSSNEDQKPYSYHPGSAPQKLPGTQSSSADDYRSVIDDLTVEIQKLKEELKRYKQRGPDMLRKEKLFEIKIHGLPKRKKRELETTLRDFAANLNESPDASSSNRKNSSRFANRDHMYSGSRSASKHTSSPSGSNTRPVDSAYASMSTGANSSGTSLTRPSMSSRTKYSEQKVQSYLRDIPEGLYPRSTTMTDKEKKKLVVRRLEQLFTGKIGGRRGRLIQSQDKLAPVVADSQPASQPATVHQPPRFGAEPAREARILPPYQHPGHSGKKSRSRDNCSASNSGGDQTESRGNGNSSGSGANTSPPMPLPPEQRPTRPKDLDPDRIQNPSENMEYIRHLGLVPPELLPDANQSTEDVHPDADGWVYLNLLCNLAQLHIINVTPSFVRSAVSDVSTKFQLSPDGRKIRWRGGVEGTRLGSDSSGENSQGSIETDETDISNKEEARKRQKTGRSTGDEALSGGSCKNPSKFGPQISTSSESFHYKPLFVRRDSSKAETSMDDTLSSFGPVEDSNVGDSRWGLSGSGATGTRRKRRHDGAIIYYSGAPFCTDLSGEDPGDTSSGTQMLSSGQEPSYAPSTFARPLARRSASGASFCHKPLCQEGLFSDLASKMLVDNDEPPGLITDSGEDSSDLDMDLPWTRDQQYMDVHPLEPCGLGGVLPDDHFMVVVTTKRPKTVPEAASSAGQLAKFDEVSDGIVTNLATRSTSSPMPVVLKAASSRSSTPGVEIEYVSGRIKRLAPVPLPPPGIFFPPFSSDPSSEDDVFGSEDDGDFESSSGFVSRQANPHQSDDYPDGVDLSSGDEDGEDPDEEVAVRLIHDQQIEDIERHMPLRSARRQQVSGSVAAAAGTARERSMSASADLTQPPGGSSAATAGGVASDATSDEEMSS